MRYFTLTLLTLCCVWDAHAQTLTLDSCRAMALRNNRQLAVGKVQQDIADVLEQMVGKVCKIVIDRREGEWLIGRTEYDSPEVDCEVLIPYAEECQTGHFYQARITKAEEFDLYGEIVVNS